MENRIIDANFDWSNIPSNYANSIWQILFDFDLGQIIVNIPNNVILFFNGGSFTNGTINGNNTIIKSSPYKILNTSLITNGTWNLDFVYPEWFGAIGNGIIDDQEALQKCFNFSSGIIVFFNNIYYISTELNINNPISIICSKKSSLISDIGNLFFINIYSSNVTIDGIHIDGKSEAKNGIKVYDNCNNIKIINSSIENLIGDSSSQAMGIDIGKECNEILLRDNLITNLIEFPDGNQGNSIGANRGVQIGENCSVIVDGCIFDEIQGDEDGDCIHVSTEKFDEEHDDKWSFIDVKISNCTFKNIYKRGIKLQASGVVIDNCLFFSNYVGEDYTNAAIEAFGAKITVSNCRIKFKKAANGIIIRGRNCNVIGNTIEIDKAKAYNNTFISSGIFLNGKNAIISNNNIDVNNTGVYTHKTAKKSIIVGNIFSHRTNYGIRMFESKEIAVKSNFIQHSDDLPRITECIKAEKIEDCSFESNSFYGGNSGIRFYGICKIIHILGNVFYNITNKYNISSLTSSSDLRFRFEDEREEIIGTGNPNGIFSASRGSRFTDTLANEDSQLWIKTSFSGSNGWKPILDLKSGNTISRPSPSEIGTSYFDTDLNKPIWWSGSNWVDSLDLKSGNTISRPLSSEIGASYFDTDLSKPIWWSGSNWIDSTGNIV